MYLYTHSSQVSHANPMCSGSVLGTPIPLSSFLSPYFQLKWIGKVYSSGGPAAVPFLSGAQLGAACMSHPAPGRTVEQHLAVWEAMVHECCCPTELKTLLESISSQVCFSVDNIALELISDL